MFTYTKTKNRILSIILCALLCLSVLFIIVPGQVARADTEVHGVLAELSSDPTFNLSMYPEIDGSYDVDVIQFAESTGGKLVVYLYVPGVDTVTITDISISATSGNSVEWHMYALEELSTDGVFKKYLVKDFAVRSEAVRTYDVSGVYRLWVSGVDEDIEGGDVNKKSIPIAKRYTAITTSDGKVFYACERTEVITVTAMYAGFLRYGANVFGDKARDGHYVAFSTDKPMDKLMQADVTYYMQSYMFTSEYSFDPWNTIATWFGAENTQTSVTETYGEKTREFKKVKSNEKASFTEPGWFADTYTWDRIQTVAEFKAQCNLTDGIAAAIDDMDWVLRFVETDYSYHAMSSSDGHWTKDTATGTRVTEVNILRLMFATPAGVYNLGVVSDVVSGDIIPDNPPDKEPQAPDPSFWDKLWAWLQKNWQWVLIAVAVIILLPVICTAFPVVFQVIAAVFKALWWLISLPFKGIAALVRKIKDKRDGA